MKTLIIAVLLCASSCRTARLEGLAADRAYTKCCTCLVDSYVHLPTDKEVFVERCLISEETNRDFAINQCVDAMHDKREVLVVPPCLWDRLCKDECSFAEVKNP